MAHEAVPTAGQAGANELISQAYGHLVKFPFIPATYQPDTFPSNTLAGHRDLIAIFRRAIPEFQQRVCRAAQALQAQGGAHGGATAEGQGAKFASEFEAVLAHLEQQVQAAGSPAKIAPVPNPTLGPGTPLEAQTNPRYLCRKRDELMHNCLAEVTGARRWVEMIGDSMSPQRAVFQGFDVFRLVKAQENLKALGLLPGVLGELDRLAGPRERLLACLEGVLAGNIFDLGSKDTADLHAQGGVGFVETRGKLKPRPWLVDGTDALLDALLARTCRLADAGAHVAYRQALLFVDNAGADVVLGMVPLARELLRSGAAGSVALVANWVPSINDITAPELRALLPALAPSDPLLDRYCAEGRLTVVSSGSDLPVIDLRGVSPELAAVCGSPEETLVVLEGMGRSIESNLTQPLLCDSVRIGMCKHKEVAAGLGGELYDCVCAFGRGGHSPVDPASIVPPSESASPAPPGTSSASGGGQGEAPPEVEKGPAVAGGAGLGAARTDFARTKVVGSTRWLALETLTYTDHKGKERLWDRCVRTTKASEESVDAVVIFTVLKEAAGDHLLLVKQFRPPVNACTLELPAGLIDNNETPEQAAVRELKEECGYTGTVTGVSTPLCMSPGLCNETVYLITVEVDLALPANQVPAQQLDAAGGEFCEVVKLRKDKLLEGLREMDGQGVKVFALLYCLAAGFVSG